LVPEPSARRTKCNDKGIRRLRERAVSIYDAAFFFFKCFGIEQPPTDFFFWVIEQIPQEA
jgi:hypothetical protein